MEIKMDIGWILTDKIRVTKQARSYLIESLSTPYRNNVSITFSRMLFNGEDIETEDFMAYVGLLDQVNASHDNPVIIDKADF